MVVDQAGWRTCGRGEWKALGDWLVARALEHDAPSVLFAQALDQLRAERVVRPGLDRLARAVATARVAAGEESYRRLGPELTPERCEQLDALLVTDPDLGVARLVWLNDGATSVVGRVDKGRGRQAGLPGGPRSRRPGPERRPTRTSPPAGHRGPALHPQSVAPDAPRAPPPHPSGRAGDRPHRDHRRDGAHVRHGTGQYRQQRPRPARRARNAKLSRPTWSAWCCSTTSSTSSWTIPSTTPPSVPQCGGWAPSAWLGRHAATTNAHLVTVGTWSWWRPGSRMSVRSPHKCSAPSALPPACRRARSQTPSVLLQAMNADGRRHVARRRPDGSSPPAGVPTSTRRPGRRRREPVQALLGAVRALRPPRRAALRGDSGCKAPGVTPTPPPTSSPRGLARGARRRARAHRHARHVRRTPGRPRARDRRYLDDLEPSSPAPTARSASTKTASST